MSEIEFFIENLSKSNGLFTAENFAEKHGLKSKSRIQSTAFLRHELISRMYWNSSTTLTKIGKTVNRHHATILHSIEVAKDMANHPDYIRAILPHKEELDQINYSI